MKSNNGKKIGSSIVAASMIICFVLTFYTLGSGIQKRAEIKEMLGNHFGKIVDLDKVIDYELKDGEQNRLYLNLNNGTSTVYTFAEPVFYNDGGQYKCKEMKIEKQKNDVFKKNGYEYANGNNDYRINFSKDPIKGLNVFGEDFEFTLVAKTNKKVKDIEGKVVNETLDCDKVQGFEYNGMFGENTSLKYYPQLNGIKDCIVLDKYTGQNRFEFVLDTKGCNAEIDDNGNLCILNEDDEKVQEFLAPFAYDKKGDENTRNEHYTDDCTYELDKIKSGKYKLKINVSKNFLTSKNTVYPVTIDPVTGTIGNSMDCPIYQKVYSSGHHKNNNVVGRFKSSPNWGVARTLVKFNMPSSIANGAKIVSAHYWTRELTGRTGSCYADAHMVTSSWNNNTKYSTQPSFNKYSSCTKLINGNSHDGGYNRHWYKFDITNVANMWAHGTPNYGFILKAKNESQYYVRTFAQRENSNSSRRPYTVIVYENDSAAPTISSVSGNPSQWTKNNVRLTIHGATDNGGVGLHSSPYSFSTSKGSYSWQSSNVSPWYSSNRTIYVYVRDKMGNIRLCSTQKISKIDKSAPTISSISGNPNNWTNKNVELVVNGSTDNGGSGLNASAYSFSSAQNQYSWQSSNKKTYSSNSTVYVYIRDALGNIRSAGTVNINKIDKIKPTINQFTKEDDSQGGFTITVDASDKGGAGIKDYSFDDGESWQTSNAKAFAEGSNDIKLKVRDNASNTATYVPTPPSNLINTGITDTSVRLEWDASTDLAGIAKYKIYKNDELVGDSQETSYVVTGLENDTEYNFVVKAENNFGSISQPTNIITITTGIQTPQNVIASAGTDKVVVKWDKVFGATSYEVAVGDNTYVTNDNQLKVDNLESNTSYNVKIRAKIDANSGTWSEERFVVTSQLTEISGQISDDLTFETLNTYLVTDNLIVPEGKTLTIKKGALIRVTEGKSIIVNGNVVAEGTSFCPVVFTSSGDVKYGGDGDNYWNKIIVGTSGNVNIKNSIFRCGGKDVTDNPENYIIKSQGTLELINSNVEKVFNSGILINSNVSNKIINNTIETNNIGLTVSSTNNVEVKNNTINNNNIGIFFNQCSGTVGFENNIITNSNKYSVKYDLSGFKPSTFTQQDSNQIDNEILVVGGKLDYNVFDSRNTYVIDGEVEIPTGKEISLVEGTIFKFKDNGSFNVKGTLNSIGTPTKPIVFTSVNDPEYGAETATYWNGIKSSGLLNFNNSKIRYAGKTTDDYSIYSANTININNCEIEKSNGSGIYLYHNSNNVKTNTINNVAISNVFDGIKINSTGKMELIIKNNNIFNIDNVGVNVEKFIGIDEKIVFEYCTCNSEVKLKIGGIFDVNNNTISNCKKYALRTNEFLPNEFNNLETNSIGDKIYFKCLTIYNEFTLPTGEYEIPSICVYRSCLTIDKGSEIKQLDNFNSHEGYIYCQGTPNNKVVLQGTWDKENNNYNNEYSFYKSVVKISNTKIKNIQGITINDDSLHHHAFSITNSTIQNCITGINVLSNSDVEIKYNSFINIHNEALQFWDIDSHFVDCSYNYWGNCNGPEIIRIKYTSENPFGIYKYLTNSNGSKIVVIGDHISLDGDCIVKGCNKIKYAPYYGGDINAQKFFGKQGIYGPTGSYSKTFTDFSMSNKLYQFDLSRTYNSKDDKQGTYFGRGWNFGYESNVSDYSTEIVDDEGNVIETKTNTGIKVVRLPNGAVNTFTANDNGTFTASDSRNKLEKIDGYYVLTAKDQTKYRYNYNDKLDKIIDKNGNETLITYNDDGRVQSLVDCTGRTYSINYQDGHISSITDALTEKAINYEYENGNLTKVIDPMGYETHYVYDNKNYLTKVLDDNNNLIYGVTYDHNVGANENKVITETDPNGKKCTYSYDNDNKIVTIKDQNNRETKKYYDDNLRAFKTVDYEGKETLTTYDDKDKFGDPTSTTDRNGNKTSYERDSKGNVTKITNSDGTFKTMTYDEKNNLISQKDESGNVAFMFYDSNCNLVKKVQPLNGTDIYKNDDTDNDAKFAITKYSYYKKSDGDSIGGLLKSETDPEDVVTSYTYDEYGNISSETLVDKTTTYSYRSDGLLLSETSPKGIVTEYKYDKNGNQIKKIINGDKVYRTVYNSDGDVVKEISPNQYDANCEGDDYSYSGDVGIRYNYYPSGNVREKIDALGNVTSYTYDIYGNVLTETLPNGLIHVNEYDMMNRPAKKYIKETSNAPQKLIESYSYVILDNHNTQTTTKMYYDSSNYSTTTVVTDFAGRDISFTDSDGLSITKTYNPNGTLKTATNKNGKITYFTYDGLNRLIGKWTPFKDELYSYVGFEYDKSSRKTKEKSGLTFVEKEVVPANCLENTFTYNADGTINTESRPNGGKTVYTYDDDGNVTSKTEYISDTKTQVINYEYDSRGNVTKEKLVIRKGDISENNFNNNDTYELITSYVYDKNGNLKEEISSNQVKTTYNYDDMDNLLSVSQLGENENDEEIYIKSSKTYDNMGQVKTETDPLGNITKYVYDKMGNVVKEIDALRNTTAYEYDLQGRLLAVVSKNNFDSDKSISELDRTEYSYDSKDRVLTQTQVYYDNILQTWKSFVEKAYKYDANGNVVKELDALGYEAGIGATVAEKIDSGYGKEYQYNFAGLLISELTPQSKEDGLSFTRKYEYDSLGRKTKEINANNSIVLYDYDEIGNVKKVSFKDDENAESNTIATYTYDLVGNKLTQTDAKGVTTTYEYNSFGKVKSVTYAGDQTVPTLTAYNQYDKVGNLSRTWDTTGKKKEIKYNNQNKVIETTTSKIDGSDAITIKCKYDANGNVRFATDGNSVTTEFTYDNIGQKLSESKSEKTTSFAYDKNSNLLSTTDWRGNVYTNYYDTFNRLTKRTDALNNIIERNTYDNNHRQIASSDALDNTTTYCYDKDGQLVMTTDPAGKQIVNRYDAVGNVVGKTDGKGNETTYSYDKQNRMLSVTMANGEITSYTYDGNGNMLTRTDASGKTTSYEYNVANKVTKIIDHNGKIDENGETTYVSGKVQNFTYTADGKIATQTKRNGAVLSYTYDCHGRMISKTAANGEQVKTVEYTYDNNNNLLTVTDETGTITRTYDAFGRVLTKAVPNIGTITYTYDITEGMDEGQYAQKAQYPNASEVTKVYDEVGRLKKVVADDNISVYAYNENGSVALVMNGDGSSEEYTYTANGLLETLTNKKSDDTVIDTYTYVYDDAKNLLSKTDNTGTTSYTYDQLNRLETETYPSGKTISYTYDGSGNRLTQTEIENSVETIISYTYDDLNRLTTTDKKEDGVVVEKTDYTYDANGNMLEKRVTPYENGIAGEQILKLSNTYDSFNQLTMSITADGKTILNKYNGEGLRIQKSVDGQATNYLYEGKKVVGEYDGDYNLKAQNVQGLNLLMRKENNDTYFYMYNGHGDVTGLLNATTGNLDASYYYDAFGNLLNKTGNINNSYLYAGYQFDEETGLYYLNARMYDAEIARFVQEDTYRGNARDPLSLNLYAYCANNPLIYTDPTGHWGERIKKAFKKGANWGKKQLNKVKKTVKKTAKKIKKTAKKVKREVKRVYNKVKKTTKSSYRYVKKKATVAKKALVNTARSTINSIKKTAVRTHNAIKTKLTSAYKKTTEIAKIAWDETKYICRESGQYIKKGIIATGDYFAKSTKQIALGNFTEDVTLLGTAGEIGLGILGFDLASDVRDVTYDFTHWEWSWGHALQTVGDSISFLPVVGCLKYTDETVKVGKNIGKMMGTAKYTDELIGFSKRANKLEDVTKNTLSTVKRFSPDQQAVVQLAKEAKKNGGAALDDANILLKWADEYKIPSHGPEIHPGRPGAASNILHFHIGKTGHIAIN